MRNERLAVAMSGGVDSSVAAALLQEQGAEVIGLHMVLREENASAAERARQAAERLGIPLQMVELREEFRRLVLEPWASAYREGRTPNPCLLCNPRVKFGALFERARELCGATRLATGHYVRLGEAEGRKTLLRGTDPAKEQSYFLALVPQETLERLVFPLGALTKTQVRQMADSYRFWAELPEESQEVCFLAGADYRSLLAEDERSGEIVDLEGHVLGRHSGLWAYTVGQRRGLGVSAPEPLYVRRLEPETNRVVVAPAGHAPFTSMIVGGLNWLSPRHSELHCSVRCRYRQADQGCRAALLEDGRLQVFFAEPQQAVAAGQGAVFYDGERVIAGGIIEEAA